jgi:MoaA/NifB/PqqE/SkfB family radical SAM enzyme/SAM-dependent methyltransferase
MTDRKWTNLTNLPEDPGFDTRWRIHPRPQATTEGMLWDKTGWKPEDFLGRTVLDAGCGCGRFLAVACKAGAKATGIDLSPHALDAAAENAPDAQLYRASLLDLACIKERFDLAYSIGVLHHTGNTRRAFHEVASLVKPGGEFAVWLYCKPSEDRLMPMVEFLHRITRACPPHELYAAIEEYAPRIREIYNGEWGDLQQVLRVSNSPDIEECISDTFDWHTPQFRDWYDYPEVRKWYEEEGFYVLWTGDFPTTMRGIKRAPRVIVAGGGPAKELPGPTSLTFLIGWKCNADCKVCWQAASRKSGRLAKDALTPEQAAMAMDRYQGRLRHVEVASFGEPMMEPAFRTILEKCMERGYSLSVITNGSLLHEYLGIAKIKGQLTVSVDSPVSEHYADLRRPLELARVVENMKSIVLDRIPGRLVGINMVVVEENWQEIPEMARLAVEEIGVDYLCFSRGENLVMTRAAGQELPALHEGTNRLIAEAVSKYGDRAVINNYFNPSSADSERPPCIGPWSHLDIGPNGHAHPCCRFYEQDYGSVLDDADPWNHHDLVLLRSRIEDGTARVLYKHCADCLFRQPAAKEILSAKGAE